MNVLNGQKAAEQHKKDVEKQNAEDIKALIDGIKKLLPRQRLVQTEGFSDLLQRET